MSTLAVDRTAVEEFLFAEADLIDDGQLDAWLALFDDDGIYWIPGAGGQDPSRFVSIVYDDKPKLVARIERLKSDLCWAQDPRSAIRHVIGNVRVDGDDGGVLVVRSNAVVVETRRQRQTVLTARNEHRLVPDGGTFRILRKKVDLLEADFFIGNLTFLV